MFNHRVKISTKCSELLYLLFLLLFWNLTTVLDNTAQNILDKKNAIKISHIISNGGMISQSESMLRCKPLYFVNTDRIDFLMWFNIFNGLKMLNHRFSFRSYFISFHVSYKLLFQCFNWI